MVFTVTDSYCILNPYQCTFIKSLHKIMLIYCTGFYLIYLSYSFKKYQNSDMDIFSFQEKKIIWLSSFLYYISPTVLKTKYVYDCFYWQHWCLKWTLFSHIPSRIFERLSISYQHYFYTASLTLKSNKMIRSILFFV